jgi:hypothetical protein
VPTGSLEWRCQLASLRQATRLAEECPDPQQIGRESLDEEEWRGGKPELRRSGDGVGRAASWRIRGESLAREASSTRRLGETRRTRLELNNPLGVSMSTIV